MRYLVKVAMFSLFVAILYFAVNIATQQAAKFIANNLTIGKNAIYILHKFKVCEAINIYISAVIGSWLVNKIINYWM